MSVLCSQVCCVPACLCSTALPRWPVWWRWWGPGTPSPSPSTSFSPRSSWRPPGPATASSLGTPSWLFQTFWAVPSPHFSWCCSQFYLRRTIMWNISSRTSSFILRTNMLTGTGQLPQNLQKWCWAGAGHERQWQGVTGGGYRLLSSHEW